MSNTLNLGDGNWATKENSLLGYNSENNNYKPLPFDFSRESSATRVNKDGLIETVGNNVPRIDYKDDSEGALLLEPSRTNKIPTSNDFNGSDWLVSDITATANQVVSPDGTLNASKLEMTGNGSLRNLSEASFNDGYAYSIFVKKGNSRYVTIRSAFFTQSIIVGFDLDTLTAQTDGKIEDYGNDWYRLSISKNISGDADKSGFFYLYLPNSLGSQTSVSGNYVYAYGGQIEDGSYATSYIPTSGGVVTRLADSCNNGGNEQVINSTEGVLFLDIEITQNSTEVKQTALCNGTTSEAVKILQLSGSTSFRFETVMSSGTNFQENLTLNPYQRNKCALQYKANDYKVFVNGVKQTVTQRSTVPVNLDRFNFNRGVSSTDNFYGNIRDVRVYNTALTDQELIALTS